MQKNFTKLIALLTLLGIASSAQAYHVIKQHRDTPKKDTVVESLPAKKAKAPAAAKKYGKVKVGKSVQVVEQQAPAQGGEQPVQVVEEYDSIPVAEQPVQTVRQPAPAKVAESAQVEQSVPADVGAQAAAMGSMGATQGQLSATAQGYTDRNLLDKDTPSQVMNRANPNAGMTVLPPEEDFGTYIMCPGDKVRINIMGHEDMFGTNSVTSGRNEILVSPDGTLMLPLIGKVQIAGKSVDQNVKEIAQRYSEYIIDPEVSLNVLQLGTTRVYVFGEIREQGMFELSKSHNLVDAIGAARGFSAKSKKKCVYVLRKNSPDFVLKVNMLELFQKNNQQCNPMLREGDVVYVSSNHKFVFAEVFSVITRSIAALADYESFRRNRRLNNE